MVQSSKSLEDGTHTHIGKEFMHGQTLLAPNTVSVKQHQVLLDNRNAVQYGCHCLISLCTNVKHEPSIICSHNFRAHLLLLSADHLRIQLRKLLVEDVSFI